MTIHSGKAPSSRYRHTATLIGSRLFLMGGSDNGDDLAEHSKEGDLDVYVLDVAVSSPIVQTQRRLALQQSVILLLVGVLPDVGVV